MKILWKCIAVLGIVSMLFGLSSCSRKQEAWNDDNLAPDEVVNRIYNNIAFYGGYAYFPQTVVSAEGVKGSTLMRQNLVTETISWACQDPLCTHDSVECPFFCGSGYFYVQFFGDWMVNQARVTRGTYRRLLYNMKTGESREIFKLFKSDDGFDGTIFCNGNYLYNAYYGNESMRTEDGETYFPCNIYRHNLRTGKEDVVYSSRTYISLTCVTDEYVYFCERLPVSNYSTEVRIRNYRYRFGAEEAESLADKWIPNEICAVYKNRMYGTSSSDIMCAVQNLESGEIVYPLKELSKDAGAIFVDGDYVYYSTREGIAEMRNAFMERAEKYRFDIENATGEGKDRLKKEYSEASREYGAAWRLIPLKIWRTDLDGNNLELVIELKNWSSTFFSVHNGVLYMPYYNVNPETGDIYEDEKDKIGLVCRVDLETGEKTVLIDLIDEEDW